MRVYRSITVQVASSSPVVPARRIRLSIQRFTDKAFSLLFWEPKCKLFIFLCRGRSKISRFICYVSFPEAFHLPASRLFPEHRLRVLSHPVPPQFPPNSSSSRDRAIFQTAPRP